MFASLLSELARVLDRSGIPYMVIGGQAVLLHGRPRLTQDIDLTLGVDASALKEVCRVCREVPLQLLPEDPEEFVRETNVLPVLSPDLKIRVDLIFSFTPYEKEAIGRSISVSLEGYPVRFATAEDLILHKLFAGRVRDLEDVESVVARKRDELDSVYLNHWAEEFSRLPGKESILPTLQRLLRSN